MTNFVSISSALALKAPASPRPARIGSRILWSVLVSVLAVSAGAALFQGYGSTDCPYGYASTDVFFSGDRLQMNGIDATVNPAQMVKVQSFGDGADKSLVGEPVSELRANGIATPHGEPCVTMPVKLPSPEPACSYRVNDYPLGDFVLERDRWAADHSYILTRYKQVQRQQAQ